MRRSAPGTAAFFRPATPGPAAPTSATSRGGVTRGPSRAPAAVRGVTTGEQDRGQAPGHVLVDPGDRGRLHGLGRHGSPRRLELGARGRYHAGRLLVQDRAVIVGGYTLDLYCDAEGCRAGDLANKRGRGFQPGSQSFFAETGGACRREARGAGWKLNRDRTATCPECKRGRRSS